MTNFWDKIAGVYDLAESINGDVYHEMCAQTERLVPAGAKVLDCAAPAHTPVMTAICGTTPEIAAEALIMSP